MQIINRQRPADWPKQGLYWLMHHDTLIEYTYDIDERWEYVLKNKPENEIDTRLAEMCPVRGELPADMKTAYRRLNAAYERRQAARKRCQVADERLQAAYERLDVADERLQAARKRLDVARERRHVAYERLDVAYERRHAIIQKHMLELEAMHKLECPDSKWDGKTIFLEK